MGGFGASAAALPEAPYSIWNIVSLVLVSMLLILVGMMMYELLRNMWGFDKPIKTTEFDTWLMDMILGGSRSSRLECDSQRADQAHSAASTNAARRPDTG